MEELATRPPLTVQEVAELRKVHQKTVRRWINVGVNKMKLRATRAGGRGNLRIEHADLGTFLEATGADEDK